MSQHWLRNFINKRQIFLSSYRRFLFQLIPLGERPRATFLRAFILDAELYFSIHYTQSEASFHFLQMYILNCCKTSTHTVRLSTLNNPFVYFMLWEIYSAIKFPKFCYSSIKKRTNSRLNKFWQSIADMKTEK